MPRLVFVIILALVATSCTSPTPTAIAIVSSQAPTPTLLPTETPSPTFTSTPTPTNVPPTATSTATHTPTPTATTTPTPLPSPTIVPPTATAKPIAPATVTPIAPPTLVPPAGWVYPAPKLLQPSNEAHLQRTVPQPGYYNGGTALRLMWEPVEKLFEIGTTPCTWDTQPPNTKATLIDRYIVEFDPPVEVWFKYGGVQLGRMAKIPIFDADPTGFSFDLARMTIDTTYTWHVAIARYCLVPNAPGKNPGFVLVRMASPWSESRTFRWSP